MAAFMVLILLIAGILLYFFPTFVAAKREHHNAGAIAALNFFLGWTALGWVIALIWALTSPAPLQERR